MDAITTIKSSTYSMLNKGDCIHTVSGESATVVSLLGEGGQGEVYEVNYRNKNMAMKWFKPNGMGEDPSSFYNNIRNNISHGAPSQEFLWPVDITRQEENGGFGYIMEIRPTGYYEVSSFMVGTTHFSSYRTVIDACLHIVSAFRSLHIKGMSYQDLNDGNFFINPLNGDVLICDNDNVAPDGTETGVIGKPRYMAPEIITGKNMPNVQSDLFSMAIILFILFCNTHPLEGKKTLVPVLTPILQEKIYGTNPVFILDPYDTSNKPDPKIHQNVLVVWKYLPAYMKKIFLKSFSKKSFSNPGIRPKEIEWQKNLIRFKNEIIKCTCGNDIFVNGRANVICEKCYRKYSIKYSIQLPEYDIPAVVGNTLYRCQINYCKPEEDLQPIGIIVINRDDKKRIGIKNISDLPWLATTPSGRTKVVESGDVVPLIDGIHFTAYGDAIEALIKEKI